MNASIPMEVLSIDGNTVRVSAGDLTESVRLDIIDKKPQVGELVIVHAGFALQRFRVDA